MKSKFHILYLNFVLAIWNRQLKERERESATYSFLKEMSEDRVEIGFP